MSSACTVYFVYAHPDCAAQMRCRTGTAQCSGAFPLEACGGPGSAAHHFAPLRPQIMKPAVYALALRRIRDRAPNNVAKFALRQAMTVQLLLQSLVNGVGLSMVYILVALGLTLIFSILRIINFAHGEFYMMGGFISYYGTQYLQTNYA